METEELETESSQTLTAAKPERFSGGPRRALLIFVSVAVLLLGYSVFVGLTSRAGAKAALAKETDAMSVPTVAVTHPKAAPAVDEVVIPGNMQAFVDTPIWARASGYIKKWYVDIGGHVKQGQLLAEIEAPEVDQQLQQVRADLGTAQANLKLSQVTAERYTGLFKSDSVSKQDVDNAVQDAAAKTAAVTSAQANVARLEQLAGYEKVYAPFDGVITARNIDTGALVDAGANTTGKELFHLSSTTTLRVYVNVPELYSQAAKPGVAAALTLDEFPGRQFHGTVVRNASAIDMASRTLLVEVDVNNARGELLPGSYASVHLKLPGKVQAMTIPSNALLFRADGLQAVTIKDGQTALVHVLVGHDYGDRVEVLSGLGSNDEVVVNSSDSVVAGERVRIANTIAPVLAR